MQNTALDLLKNTEVQAIMGPVSSVQAEFINDLGDKAHVPIISFSATSTFLSPLSSPYFIRATQNDSSQVKSLLQADYQRRLAQLLSIQRP